MYFWANLFIIWWNHTVAWWLKIRNRGANRTSLQKQLAERTAECAWTCFQTCFQCPQYKIYAIFSLSCRYLEKNPAVKLPVKLGILVILMFWALIAVNDENAIIRDVIYLFIIWPLLLLSCFHYANLVIFVRMADYCYLCRKQISVIKIHEASPASKTLPRYF